VKRDIAFKFFGDLLFVPGALEQTEQTKQKCADLSHAGPFPR
jgi:hypothetical protein